jgi:hypothetical protein
MAYDDDLLTFREFIDVCLLARITRKLREIYNSFGELLLVNDFVDWYRLSKNAVTNLREKISLITIPSAQHTLPNLINYDRPFGRET